MQRSRNLHFVIDTWVLYRARDGERKAIELLWNINEKCHKVSIDKIGEILKEYRSVPGVFISRWLQVVSLRKIVKVNIRKRCKNLLNHKKDMKFVYVCLNCSSAKSIISEEYHFVNNRDELLKKGIRVLSLDEALEVSKLP